MDLSSMLNDGPAPEKKKPSQLSQPLQPSTGPTPLPPTPSVNGHSAAATGYQSAQSTPLYAPPSAPLARQPPGLTPLQTPSQQSGGAQYPFPQQSSQSSAVPQSGGPPYSAHGPYSATSATRPSGHGYQYPQPSPSQYQGHGMPPSLYAQQTHSLSPTPPSHQSQTPHSVRQSPMSALSHAPPLPPTLQHQHSQPGTPLGPPPQYARPLHPSQYDTQSPYQSRTMSGTSNGIATGSPAHHIPSRGSVLDSPGTYNRQSPHLRRTSDYLSYIDRERSLSVSPKTKIPPRPPSLGSRQSSQQESFSARSSVQHQQGPPRQTMEVQNHVTALSHASDNGSTQPSSLPQIQSAHSNMSEVAQSTPLSVQTPYHPQSSYNASGPTPLFQASSHVAPLSAIQHNSEKMGMNHLLTPAPSIAANIDGANDAAMPPKKQQSSIFMKAKASPKPKTGAIAPPPPQPPQPAAVEQPFKPADLPANVDVKPTQTTDAATNGAVKDVTAPEVAPSEPSKKRPASSEASAEPAPKRVKSRKYSSRPVWARLHPRNPHYRADEHRDSGAPVGRPQAQPNGKAKAHMPAQPNGVFQAQPQQNGFPQANGNAEVPVYLQNPPLDNDLITARRVLGAWEKSFVWNTPQPEYNKTVSDWLWQELDKLKDIGTDPLEGTIEIEAKLGHIMVKEKNERLSMPILTPVVLQPDYCKKNFGFESNMHATQHKQMNDFLNSKTLISCDTPGRVAIIHKHPKETDSFRTLSRAGLQALPPAFQSYAAAAKRDLKRDMKLRTTTDDATGTVTARIVKIPVSDLHIFNPCYDYDCRISINLEANFNRPDLHTDDIVTDEKDEKRQPPRQKDRLSYTHLAYSVDLTKVLSEGLSPKYELEVEVNSKILREQKEKMASGQESAWTDVVAGFLDDCTLLMREKAKVGQAETPWAGPGA